MAGDGPGRLVVSTQVIEAGGTPPRRCWRPRRRHSRPLFSVGVAAIVPVSSPRAWRYGSIAASSTRAPQRRMRPPDLSTSRSALLSLVGTSVSPAMLAEIPVPETRPQSAVLRRRDLVDLFDTSPDMSGMDVDVSRFIRDEDERTVSVFFRDLERQDPDRHPKGSHTRSVTS